MTKTRVVVWGFSALLALLILFPVLWPGFVLSYDQVFVPHQSLLPWMLGLGGGLPRAVPQDMWVSLISGPIPGQLLQKALLLGSVFVAGTGAARLVGGPLGMRLVATLLAIWNPFVIERLVMGHWSLLICYAALPYLLLAVRAVRRDGLSRVPVLLLLIALGSLVPTSAVISAVLALPVLFAGSALRTVHRIVVALGIAVLSAPWAIAALVSPSATTVDSAGFSVFALHSESWGGPLLTAFGLGGVWNQDVVPTSRNQVWVPVIAVAFIVLAAFGVRYLQRRLDRPTMRWWLLVSLLGLLVAVAGAWSVTNPVIEWIGTTIPGGGLLRDGQKWLLPLAMLVACGVPAGVVRLAHAKSATSTESKPTGESASSSGSLVPAAVISLVAVGALTVLAMPDAAAGVSGRLGAANYPAAWNQVRSAIEQGAPGDAVSVPWTTFRRYGWNDNRVVLDPSPRYMTRTVLANDQLRIKTSQGLVVVSGDNPRATAVGNAIASTVPLRESMPELGVRWVIEQVDQPEQLTAKQMQGLTLVVNSPTLRLWQIPDSISVADSPKASGWRAVIAANLIYFLVIFGVIGAWLVQTWKKRRV